MEINTAGLLPTIVLALMLLVAIFLPSIFWRIPVFAKIKELEEKLGSQSISIDFDGEVRTFKYHDATSAKASLYAFTFATKRWMDGHCSELQSILAFACLAQIILVVLRITDAEIPVVSPMLSAIHFPAVEVIFAAIMVYIFSFMARRWKEAVQVFREDAWD